MKSRDTSPLFVAMVFMLSQLTQADYFSPTESTLKPRYDASDCRLWATTDMWTTCVSFLNLYGLSLPNFVNMNPSVEFDCYGFQPGVEYCLRMPSSLPVSTDGICGIQAPKRVTCVNSGFGDCCGKDGRCGSTDDFCAIGNCQAGNCPGLGYSFDGSCGVDYGDLMCGGSQGKCCSNNGRCGSTDAECGRGNCQSGTCEDSTTIESTTSTKPSPLPSPYSPSPDGTCGYVNKYTCNGTALYFGNCCSAAGYCGITQYHCDNLQGCQSDFGLCDKTVVVTVTVDPPNFTTSTISRSSSSSSSTEPSSSKAISTSSSLVTSSTTNTKPTSSAAPISTPVCISGTGPGNYQGLCDFCCARAYCPEPVCICLYYGDPIPIPAPTSPVGYPISGGDSSYLGLCSFACNHGYCPPTACTTVAPSL